MTEIKLNDNFVLSGKTIKSFYDAIDAMDKITEYSVISSKDISLMTVDTNCDNSELLHGFYHIPGHNIMKRNLDVSKLVRGNTEVKEMLLDTEKNSKMFLFLDNRRLFFTSSNLISTLASRVNLAGSRLWETTPYRNAYLAETFNEKPFNATVMWRKGNGFKKAFAVHSARYAQIPQSILREVIAHIEMEMGECECVQWEVTHNISKIYLQFPKKAKDMSVFYGLPDIYVPGIMLATSDTGDSSLTVTGVWWVKNSMNLFKTYKRKHRGNFVIKNIIEDIKKDIFVEYTKIPERLCELMSIDIENPDFVYKKLFEKLDITKALGKEVKNTVLTQLCEEIDSSICYTAYDIATTMMQLARRCEGISKSAMEQLQSITTKAVFIDYKALQKKTTVTLV